MKKITLKHSLNGKIETRTTARAYTHVTVLALNADKYVSYLRGQLSDASIKNLTRLYTSNGNFYLNQIATFNPDTAKSWDVVGRDAAVKELAGDSLEAYVARKLAEHRASIAKQIAWAIDNNGRAHVAGWSRSAANAIKNGSRWNDRYDVLAQEINNGVEK